MTDVSSNSALKAILVGGLVAALLDILDPILFFGLRGVAPIRIPQSIASGLLGRAAYSGGLRTVLLGLALHLFIALVWADSRARRATSTRVTLPRLCALVVPGALAVLAAPYVQMSETTASPVVQLFQLVRERRHMQQLHRQIMVPRSSMTLTAIRALVPPRLPPYFSTIDRERRSRMIEECARPGSELAKRIQQIWITLFTPPLPPSYIPPDEFMAQIHAAIDARFSDTVSAVNKLRGRGGDATRLSWARANTRGDRLGTNRGAL